MNFLKNKKTRVLILILSTLFILTFIITRYYYEYQNRSIDPRIVEANLLYSQYNELAQSADYEAIFHLLDTIELIYKNIEHYADSYEVGVLYNNRAATYIAKALAVENNDSIVKDSLLVLGKKSAVKSIKIYTDWISKWNNKNKEEIKELLKPHFNKNDSVFKDKNINRFINRRAVQIKEAQVETPRRLSVSLTNLGIIYRHQEKYEEAVIQYIQALELWPDNLSAENNLNIIFDKPQKKPSILRRLFPKDRL